MIHTPKLTPPRLRFLSAILAVAMFFTLLPVSALAEDSGNISNTGLTISIVGGFNNWATSSTPMKEVSPAVYEVTIENTSYDEINSAPGFKFIKDNYADEWSSSVTASSGISYPVNYGDYSHITVSSGSDASTSVHNFIIRLDLTNWDWDTKTGATFTVTVTSPSQAFRYSDKGSSISIYEYTGTDASVTIPSEINGKPVTAIEADAFEKNTTIKSVSIPASVTLIDIFAFSRCSNLSSVTFAENSQLKTIQSCAFEYCTSLTSIAIPDGVTFIGDNVFDRCSNLESISIPESVTSIGYGAFYGCTNLEEVNYPGSITQWEHINADGSTASKIPLACAKLEATFTADGVTFAPVQTIDRGGKFTEPTSTPEKEGHTFIGWYNGNEKFDFSADTTSAPNVLDLVAKWNINQYTVTFVTAHGITPAPQTVDYGKTATRPTIEAEGYTFGGWHTDEACTAPFDFDMPITGNLTLYANWLINEYIVAFEDANGEPGQRVTHGDTATKPDDPKRTGFTFDGWYTDDTYTTEFDFTQPITSDTTVYAKWEKDAPVTPDPEPTPEPKPDPEPETYELNVSGAFVYVDGVDLTAASGDTSLTPAAGTSIRLVADPDRMPSGMVFDRWTVLSGKLLDADAEKLETSRTLTEFTFTMPAEPLSIEATPRMLEEESSDTASVILGVTLGTAATAVVAWQAYDIGMTLYQEHWLPADFIMPKTRAELALLLWNAAGRPATAAQPAFADITDPDTAQAAQWAVETGLLTTKSADTFQPDKSVPRWKAVRTWNRVTK